MPRPAAHHDNEPGRRSNAPGPASAPAWARRACFDYEASFATGCCAPLTQPQHEGTALSLPCCHIDCPAFVGRRRPIGATDGTGAGGGGGGIDRACEVGHLRRRPDAHVRHVRDRPLRHDHERGRFSSKDGSVSMDGSGTSGHVDITLDISSINTGGDLLNRHREPSRPRRTLLLLRVEPTSQISTPRRRSCGR